MALGCTPADLDDDQAAVARRTCASLRERVAARALENRDLDTVIEAAGPKADPLDVATFAEDPDAWWAALEQALDRAELGPPDQPTGRSPAAELVQACQDLAR